MLQDLKAVTKDLDEANYLIDNLSNALQVGNDALEDAMAEIEEQDGEIDRLKLENYSLRDVGLTESLLLSQQLAEARAHSQNLEKIIAGQRKALANKERDEQERRERDKMSQLEKGGWIDSMLATPLPYEGERGEDGHVLIWFDVKRASGNTVTAYVTDILNGPTRKWTDKNGNTFGFIGTYWRRKESSPEQKLAEEGWRNGEKELPKAYDNKFYEVRLESGEVVSKGWITNMHKELRWSLPGPHGFTSTKGTYWRELKK